MVIFGKCNAQTLTLSSKPNAFTLSLQGEGRSSVFSFDGEGRLWTAMFDGISYRRGLDGKTVAKSQPDALQPMGESALSSESRERRWLSALEAAHLAESARLTVEAMLAALQSGQAQLSEPLPHAAQDALRAIVRCTPEQYGADTHHYAQVYAPVGILPPEQYMAVVLQATLGCSFNTCTFCNFYRERPFRIRSSAEFRKHAQAVHAFLGAGLALRRTLFLGDANALVIPTPRLLELLEIVHQEYDVEKLGGIFAFLDGFSGEKKTERDYLLLAGLGVKRVYIGLESGSPELLHLLKKPGQPADAVQAVRAMKSAGISVGVIVLLGAGGQTYASAHVKDTIRVLNDMRLGMDDLLYFSELIESEGLEYSQLAYQQQLQPLTSAQRIAQGAQIEAGLRFNRRDGTPHISRYDIRDFLY